MVTSDEDVTGRDDEEAGTAVDGCCGSEDDAETAEDPEVSEVSNGADIGGVTTFSSISTWKIPLFTTMPKSRREEIISEGTAPSAEEETSPLFNKDDEDTAVSLLLTRGSFSLFTPCDPFGLCSDAAPVSWDLDRTDGAPAAVGASVSRLVVTLRVRRPLPARILAMIWGVGCSCPAGIVVAAGWLACCCCCCCCC